MSTTTTWSLTARARTAIDAPYSGHGVAESMYSAEWTSGTGDNQADRAARAVYTIPAGGNVDVDLRAMSDANGDAVNGAELAGLIVEIPSTASGVVTLKRGAATGVPILSGTTDGLPLGAGSRMLLVFPADGGPAMSASAKDINLANAGASDTVVTITCLQRSA